MSGTKGKLLIQPLNLGGLESPSPGDRAVADGCGFAHLLSTFPDVLLRAGHGIQVGAQGPWHISLHTWSWGSPRHRLGTESITCQSKRLRLGKGKAAGRLFSSPCQGPWDGTGLDSRLGQHSCPPFPGS